MSRHPGIPPSRPMSPEGQPREFLAIPVNRASATRCIDGRPQTTPSPSSHASKEVIIAANNSMAQDGAQMPGGSLMPVLLKSLYGPLHGPIGDAIGSGSFVRDLWPLEEAGYGIGFHRGETHGHGENESGCGFADKIKAIVEHVQNAQNQGEISSTLSGLYTNPENTALKTYLVTFGIQSEQNFQQALNSAFKRIGQYKTNNIEATGEQLVTMAQQRADMRTNTPTAVIPNLGGPHNEEIAFINLNPDVTFNAKEANMANWQAFNMDLPAVVEQAKLINSDPRFVEFAAINGLIIYIGTLRALGKLGKGTQNIPVVVNG